MNLARRNFSLCAVAAIFSTSELAIAAPKDDKNDKKGKKHVHNDGKKLASGKLKQDGKHEIGKKKGNTVSVVVKDGKIAGMQVKHDKKGDVAVKKYKTAKRMVLASGVHYASFQLAQAYSLGTTYIGYAYIDEDGYEEIYWYPYEMIYDGETGAIDYVPVY